MFFSDGDFRCDISVEWFGNVTEHYVIAYEFCIINEIVEKYKILKISRCDLSIKCSVRLDV